MKKEPVEKLYDAHSNEVRQWVRDGLPHVAKQTREDIEEQIWVIVLERFRNTAGCPEIVKPKDYIFVITQHEIKKYLHGCSKKLISTDDISIYETNVVEENKEQDIIHSEESTVLHKCLDEIPRKYRIPFMLNVLKGMKRAKIAAMLHVSPAQIGDRISYAKKLLRKSVLASGMF